MAEICCGPVAESDSATSVESMSRDSRRRWRDLVPVIKTIAESAVESGRKRRKHENRHPKPALEIGESARKKQICDISRLVVANQALNSASKLNSDAEGRTGVFSDEPKYGFTSVCGKRRDMEDAVSIHTSFHRENSQDRHFFGVFDGHGCSHVAEKCRERLHEVVKEEMAAASTAAEWKDAMERSFYRMDEEVSLCFSDGHDRNTASCRCELQAPQRNTAGSTATVAVVTPEKIVVSSCGDSRAVLCRNGVVIPLSSDHKPDRPDELLRIQQAGGRVIYWDGPRVLGVLAMSRAIGDSYLKPYVIPEPEVTVTDRTEEDECLILASDGLWDVVTNETACAVARMCLRTAAGRDSGAACSDAALLLTKMAMARHSTDNVSVVVVDLRRNPR